MSASITVRDARAADIPAACQVKRTAAVAAYGPAHAGPALDTWLDVGCRPEHFAYRLARPALYRVLVAELDGRVCGVAVVRPRGDRADMSDLYVDRPGRGVGRALICARQQAALDLGCTSQRTSVWRTNAPAARLAENLGMTRGRGFRDRTVGVMVDYYDGPLSL